MRFILGVGLLLLCLWLYNAQTSDNSLQRDTCAAVSASEAVAALLLSPLSLYAWFTSTLLRLLLSLPALLLTSVYHSLLLLLLAWPCSLLSICASLALACLRLALYLLHLALALAAVALLSGTRLRNAGGGEQACQPKTPETLRSRSRLELFDGRVVQQG